MERSGSIATFDVAHLVTLDSGGPVFEVCEPCAVAMTRPQRWVAVGTRVADGCCDNCGARAGAVLEVAR